MSKFDVAIIGGGPAGLTAGLYASRAGLRTVLLEKSMFGGQIVNAHLVENYPGFPDGISGYDLALHMQKQASKFGLEFINEEVTSIAAGNPYQVKTADNSIETSAIIIACGAQYSQLGIKGEDIFLGKGVSYCATCDGYMFKDKKVAVVGGGDTALSDALELSQHCSEVHLVHRRDQLRASQVLQNRAFSDTKIKFIWDSVVEEISGDTFMQSLKLKNLKSGETSTLEVSGIFIAVGTKPNSGIFKNAVQIDENGLIITDQSMTTSAPGIFAAGDIRRYSPRQVAAAVGDGASAAIAAFKYLKG